MECSVTDSTTSRTVARLAGYDGLLRSEYGLGIAEIRAETERGWEHLVACAEQGQAPETAVARLANALGLVPCGSLFARRLEEAEVYNRYRLALRAYGEEAEAAWDSAGQSPIEIVDGRSLVWGVLPRRNDEGRILGCEFCLHDPRTNAVFRGVDIDEAREHARSLIRERRFGEGSELRLP